MKTKAGSSITQLYAGMVFVLVLALATACAQGPSLKESRAELQSLVAKAKTGNAEVALASGEQALKMMDTYTESEVIDNEGMTNFIFEAFDASILAFEMALQKDAGNEKALAYLASLKPMRSLKGFYWRSERADSEWQMYSLVELMLRTDRSFEANFNRFLFTPPAGKEKFQNDREEQDEVIRPWAKDTLESVDLWDKLGTNEGLDIELFLPRVMSPQEIVRVRTADARTLSNLALAMGLLGDSEALYKAGLVDHNTNTREQEFKTNMLDPEFGVITDPTFYKSLKGRADRFVDGSELVLNLLKQRYESGQNSSKDAFHMSERKFMTCGDVIIDSKGHGHVVFPHRCYHPHEVQLHLTFTSFKSYNRMIMDNEGMEVTEPVMNADFLEDADNIRRSDWQYQTMLDEIKLTRKIFMGPEKLEGVCNDRDDKPYKTTYWIDVPTYIQNPIDDIKSLDPMIDKDEHLISLNDHTLHGLFPQGLPCQPFLQGSPGAKHPTNSEPLDLRANQFRALPREAK